MKWSPAGFANRRPGLYDLVLPSLLILVALPVLYYTLFMPGIHFNDDMFQEYSSCAIFRQGVLHDHAFTLWTPLVGGGYPTYAHPHESSFVAMFWPAVLAFGEVWGVRINILLLYLIGVAGMYGLSARFMPPGYRRSGAMAATLLYAASPLFVETVVSGNFNELMAFTFPAILLAAERGMRSRAWFVAAAILIAFIAFFGKYSFLYVMAAVSAFGAWHIRRAADPTDRRPLLGRLAVLLIVAVGISMVKIIPMIDLISASSYESGGAPRRWRFCRHWGWSWLVVSLWSWDSIPVRFQNRAVLTGFSRFGAPVWNLTACGPPTAMAI